MSSPQLRFFAGLWTLRGYPTPEHEWTIEQKFAEIKRQGFHGVGGRFLPQAPELCRRYDLAYVLYIDASDHDFAAQLQQAKIWTPCRINLQLGEHDTHADDAARWWQLMMEHADSLGLEIDLELHRDTATETPEKSYEIADRYFQATGRLARCSLDFSHFAVTKHLAPPFAPRLLERKELLGKVRQVHARPFNGHHAQIPATDGRGGLTPEFLHYRDFFKAFLQLWLELNPRDATLWVCPENGPRDSGYALSCFPDVWQDALRIRDEIGALWQRQCQAGPI